MLLKFMAANWRSIRDPQELSMYRAGPAKRAIGNDNRWDSEVSALAAVYGPNASGKSTLIDALRYMQHVVRDSYRSWDADEGTNRVPFFLSLDSPNEPSKFEVEFRGIDANDYQYGFSLDDEKVLTEYLYLYRKGTKRRTVLFERGLKDDDPEFWHFGGQLRAPVARIKETTRPNSLFLSAAAAASSGAFLSIVTHWFRSELSIYDAPAYAIEHDVVARKIREEDGFQRKLLAFLEHSDLGVTDIGVDGELEERSSVPEDGPDRLSIRIVGEPEDEETENQLRLSHSNGVVAMDLPFDWESDGTKALISFASIALQALDNGTLCVVDEIDTSLHPLLVAELVSVFANPSTNPRQAQLIFTTHDVSLLRRWDHRAHGLEKDQVWLVEKGRDGASTLTALLEYGRARKDENLARGYLTGRFGAIPSTSIALALMAAQGDDGVTE